MAWPQVRTVTVRRVGLAQRRSIVVTPADQNLLVGPDSAHRRRVANGTAFVAADIDAAGMPLQPVLAALQTNSGGRFVAGG